MKSTDGLREHQERMHALATQARHKIAYHREKAYITDGDIYWLVHEVLGGLLGTDAHHTEEELSSKLASFSHPLITIPPEIISEWHKVLTESAKAQYSGTKPSQEALHSLLERVAELIERTMDHVSAPLDAFTRHVQAVLILTQNGEFERAEEQYLKLHEEYSKLPEEQKRVHYTRLQNIYKSILGARSEQPVAHH